ncbi:LysR family transcriptional regulator [Ochrobactrum sp. C6C9]|uniref:LysR family transcriptional regulator n=1 Tax=Ochrobactrum sp. C6C9 TaxID=2736662 RepID=UPI00352FFB65|nr:LysR family transcriptional regulator [Ochrobactrum sp. C6C9]
MRLPKIELLLTFRAVAEQSSFTRAATLLNQSQSAVSHQIRKLEEELGVQLFTRSAHSVNLTISGTALLSRILEPLANLEHACQAVSNREKSSRLSVELEPAFAAHWLIERLPQFTEKHLDMQLDMHLSTHRFEFPSHVEFAVKWGTGNWSGCEARKLLELHMTPMCSAAFHAKFSPFNASSFKSLRLLHDRDFQFWSLWFEKANIERPAFSNDYIFDDMNVVTATAMNGTGMMLGIIEFSEQALQSGALIAPFREIAISPPQAYYIVSRKEGKLTNHARGMRQWLLDIVGHG